MLPEICNLLVHTIIYLLSCLFAKMTPMSAILAAIPIVPKANISAASAVPPGWHWNTRVAFKLVFVIVLPKRRLAPIIATAEPVGGIHSVSLER